MWRLHCKSTSCASGRRARGLGKGQKKAPTLVSHNLNGGGVISRSSGPLLLKVIKTLASTIIGSCAVVRTCCCDSLLRSLTSLLGLLVQDFGWDDAIRKVEHVLHLRRTVSTRAQWCQLQKKGGAPRARHCAAQPRRTRSRRRWLSQSSCPR